MRRRRVSVRSLLWPALAAALLSGAFVVFQPGQLRADAGQYDELAQSILRGRYELDGAPTMYREPLYPMFRAGVYAVVGYHPAIILWIQTLLSVATILIVARTVKRLDPRWELPVAWLTALYPGFAIWASQHLSETFAAFLLAAAGWLFVRLREETRRAPGIARAASFGAVLGLLILAKASYQLLPLAAAASVLIGAGWKTRVRQAAAVVAASVIVVLPWIVRNGTAFGSYGVTQRSGVVAYARAVKAEAPWGQLAASAGSVLAGQATVIRFAPRASPVILQHWKRVWDDLEGVERAASPKTADAVMMRRAQTIVFGSAGTLAKYLLWTPVDEMRLFALSSPLSPTFGIEGMFNVQATQGNLTVPHLGVLWAAHLAQIAWWILLLFGFWRLVRARLWRHPSILLVGYTALIYAPFDDIARYSAPALPWMMALVVAALVKPRAPDPNPPVPERV